MRTKVISVFFGVSIFLLIITASISLPILCRFFYYIQIDALNLEKLSGFDYDSIRQAYDQVLTYLTVPWAEFGVGVMKYSAEGASHFADCKGLFMLNFGVLIASAVSCVTIFVLDKKRVISLSKPKGFGIGFYASISAVVLPLVIGSLACIDFDKSFVIFHKIFFPGKDNWIFNPQKDEIIKILPEDFFMNCAIFIGVGLVVIAVTIIVVEIIKRNRRKKYFQE